MSIQPFKGSDKVVLEKYDEKGRLDFSMPQPSVLPMTFDQVYEMYFREVKTGESADWDQLKAWLESKRWRIRACTW